MPLTFLLQLSSSAPSFTCARTFLAEKQNVSLLESFAASIKKVSTIYAPRSQRCGDLDAVLEGRRIHSRIQRVGLHRDLYLGNLLVQMYGKCGVLEEAKSVFIEMDDRNVFSWSLLLSSYIEAAHNEETSQIFSQMQLEGVIPDKVFDGMLGRNIISWNAMITACISNELSREAFTLYQQMQLEGFIPNKVTCISLFTACANQEGLLNIGKRMHASIVGFVFELDVVVATSLVNMYGKSGSVYLSLQIFECMLQRNVVSWNAILTACVLNEHGSLGLTLYKQMLEEGFAPDNITFICVLDACSDLGALGEGQRLHSCLVGSQLESDVAVGNSVLNMYGKCAASMDVQNIFENMQGHNVSSWNTIIATHGQHGNGNKVLDIYETMQVNGVTPDRITYFSLISSCSHAGLLAEGCYFFSTMKGISNLSPTVEHYNCIIDLLGRAGLLDEAEELIRVMHVPASIMTWTTLLSACRMHMDEERIGAIERHVLNVDH